MTVNMDADNQLRGGTCGAGVAIVPFGCRTILSISELDSRPEWHDGNTGTEVFFYEDMFHYLSTNAPSTFSAIR